MKFVQESSMIFLYVTLLLQGLLTTTMIWLVSALLSALIGTSLGIFGCRQLGSMTIRLLVACYVYLFRGVPVYVQLLIVYFVIPDVFNINLPAWLAAVFALGLCSAAYLTEIVRAGMNSVGAGQWDACLVLGYSKIDALRYVIMPQMIRGIYPALINEFESLLKSTALVSVIGVLDMTKVASNIVARTMDPLPVYGIVACFYLLLSAFLNGVSKVIEWRMVSCLK